jgi:hypothetical protein
MTPSQWFSYPEIQIVGNHIYHKNAFQEGYENRNLNSSKSSQIKRITLISIFSPPIASHHIAYKSKENR